MPPTGVVYVVDDDDLLRAALREMVQSVGLRAVEFSSPRQFLAAPFEDGPSCVVLDLRLPEMGGLEVFELLRQRRNVPVIFLTAFGAVPLAVQALKSGAFDFLEKPCPAQTLLERIQAAVAADDALREQGQREGRRRKLAALSDREREVLELVVTGQATKAIARRLNISTKTVEYHRANIFSKLHVENVVQLVRLVLGVDAPDALPEVGPPALESPTPG